MHQEISKRDKVSALWLCCTILVAAFILIGFNTILVRLNLNSSLTDFAIIGLSVAWTYSFIRKNMVSFKYCLIEDEIIIHEVIGSKEKRILNLNVYQIKAFEPITSETFNDYKKGTYRLKKRLYNCDNKTNRRFMVYEEADHQCYITLQPSAHMIHLIEDKLNTGEKK